MVWLWSEIILEYRWSDRRDGSIGFVVSSDRDALASVRARACKCGLESHLLAASNGIVIGVPVVLWHEAFLHVALLTCARSRCVTPSSRFVGPAHVSLAQLTAGPPVRGARPAAEPRCRWAGRGRVGGDGAGDRQALQVHVGRLGGAAACGRSVIHAY